MNKIQSEHETMRAALLARPGQEEASVLNRIIAEASLDAETRQAIGERAAALVRRIRQETRPGLMELFLAEYGLSTDEGVALMCLAEALLRVPDAATIDQLIDDKISPSGWASHMGQSSSPLVNASTWALMLTGAVLRDDEDPGVIAALRGAVKRLGEPVIRTAVGQAMRELGRQFVLGETIEQAMRNAAPEIKRGYSFSYDMLGEAARTESHARRYHLAYSEAISALAKTVRDGDIRDNPGVSVKLSALHPRYEPTRTAQLKEELAPRILSLAQLARSAGMGFNIDAEEAHRLVLSLDMFEAVLASPGLAGWDGFGIVVQSYDKRAPLVVDWLYDLATRLDRRIMVRLVKGAYWDTEIKRAQSLGTEQYPVFTRKAASDACFIACARKLLSMQDRIYPQFATHNAHTAAAVLELAPEGAAFEFQRLHGMGEALHDVLVKNDKVHCRIYAPVGNHRDLLAYLVRRLLENGSNSSFVNQIVDENVPVEKVAADPIAVLEQTGGQLANPNIPLPPQIFSPRLNSAGWELMEPHDRARMEAARAPFSKTFWRAAPLLAAPHQGAETRAIVNPADETDRVGEVLEAGGDDIELAFEQAAPWAADGAERARILRAGAALYEAHAGELFALLAREAGKTPFDAVAEIREAVDFLRYYADELEAHKTRTPRGIFTCISPWNFPLAIFTGQIAAALAAGNGVLAKPAGQTALIAHRAVQLLLEAGVPQSALQFCPGDGRVVGARLVADRRIGGVCFTGGTGTAQHINRAMAEACPPGAALIAETGGLNAMIVDSTALPEQAVRDIISSAFQSAGQRCSALRLLYVQDDIADDLLEMLSGAMDTLEVGDPWAFSCDAGPVIDAQSQAHISAYVDEAEAEGRLLKRLRLPETAGKGHFVAPAIVQVSGIGAMEEEIFGPVLHVARFKAQDIDRIIDDINAAGYGLTFGLHTRIDDRVQHMIDRVHAGNLYVNRNQIGAIVGSQPFGGEGMSGTGPKAGGPHYLPRFFAPEQAAPEKAMPSDAGGPELAAETVQSALSRLPAPDARMRLVTSLPGPTGESNRLGLFARGKVLCLGPSAEDAAEQAREAEGAGCTALIIAPGALGDHALDGRLAPDALTQLEGFAAVVFWGDDPQARALRRALAARTGALLPLITERAFATRLYLERHVCIDTTATGGNADLLAASA